MSSGWGRSETSACKKGGPVAEAHGGSAERLCSAAGGRFARSDHWLWPVPGERAGDDTEPDRGLGVDEFAGLCGPSCAGDQDTSEINFTTTAQHRRGLGETGKGGNVRGALLHAMLALDAGTGEVLGLVSGQIWTRDGRVETSHGKRLLADKESQRWLATAEAAKSVLVQAAMVTEVSDRESDIYAKWDRVPGPNFHILTRAMSDRLIEGGKLSTAKLQPAGEADVKLRARPGRPARTAHLVARFGQVALKRPQNCIEKGLAETVTVSLVEVVEVGAPIRPWPGKWSAGTGCAGPSSSSSAP